MLTRPPWNEASFAELIRRTPVLSILMALDKTQTLSGVERIAKAERHGRCRRRVLRAAERRIEQIRGAEPDAPRSNLIVAAESVH